MRPATPSTSAVERVSPSRSTAAWIATVRASLRGLGSAGATRNARRALEDRHGDELRVTALAHRLEELDRLDREVNHAASA